MRLVALVPLLVVSAGCALRPLYRELVPGTSSGNSLHFTLRDATTHQAIGNAKIEVGEGRGAVRATTSPQGHFSLPVKPKFDERAMVVVSVPAGVTGYVVEPTATASLELGYRCGALFDEVSPLMVAEWARAMPEQVEGARKALPELRAGFVEGCQQLTAGEVACGEVADRQEACRGVPADQLETCLNSASLPTWCRGIAEALDVAGRKWAGTYLKPTTRTP